MWIDPNNPNPLILIIRWQSKEQWEALPQGRLAEMETKFARAIGNSQSYEMLEEREYQVRKFADRALSTAHHA